MSMLPIEAVRMGGSADPPFETTYKDLLEKSSVLQQETNLLELPVVEECELPLIDLQQLGMGEVERQACKKLIAEASQEWGFFQIINHGVSQEVAVTMRGEQMKLFEKPFEEKKGSKDYRWGNSSPTSLKQLSWSEAFHVQLSDTNSSMEQFALTVCDVARQISEILAEEMERESETGYFKETCLPSSCYLRLNRYLACPAYSHMMGLMAHTDTSFVTVLHQDNVGGLQLLRDGKWIAVKPNPSALIVNIGDLFQAWSNNLYKSVEHRVVANPLKERFSTAFFYCPPNHTAIQSAGVYRSFTYGEYKKQIELDVQSTGQKIGLQRFLLHT